MGRLDDAAATAREAITLFEQLGNTMRVAHTQRDVGWLHLRAGRPADAEAPLTHAVNACAAAGDAYAGAMARHPRGVAHRELGRYPEAHSDFDAVLDVCRAGSCAWNQAAVSTTSSAPSWRKAAPKRPTCGAGHLRHQPDLRSHAQPGRSGRGARRGLTRAGLSAVRTGTRQASLPLCRTAV
ncbi:tetratricopeptide repeat protein [Streptomyces sp. NPDC058735]